MASQKWWFQGNFQAHLTKNVTSYFALGTLPHHVDRVTVSKHRFARLLLHTRDRQRPCPVPISTAGGFCAVPRRPLDARCPGAENLLAGFAIGRVP